MARAAGGQHPRVQTLRLIFAVVAGLRAVLVYGEAPALTSEPWALRKAERLLTALSWRPKQAAQAPVGQPVHSG